MKKQWIVPILFILMIISGESCASENKGQLSPIQIEINTRYKEYAALLKSVAENDPIILPSKLHLATIQSTILSLENVPGVHERIVNILTEAIESIHTTVANEPRYKERKQSLRLHALALLDDLALVGDSGASKYVEKIKKNKEDKEKIKPRYNELIIPLEKLQSEYNKEVRDACNEHMRHLSNEELGKIPYVRFALNQIDTYEHKLELDNLEDQITKADNGIQKSHREEYTLKSLLYDVPPKKNAYSVDTRTACAILQSYINHLKLKKDAHLQQLYTSIIEHCEQKNQNPYDVLEKAIEQKTISAYKSTLDTLLKPISPLSLTKRISFSRQKTLKQYKPFLKDQPINLEWPYQSDSEPFHHDEPINLTWLFPATYEPIELAPSPAQAE